MVCLVSRIIDNTHTYQHKVGRAVLHLGNRRHGADDIKSGTRCNLIIWNHNEAYRGKGVNAWDRDRNEVYEVEEGEPHLLYAFHIHMIGIIQTLKHCPSEAALKQKRKPWCPPSGREYEGYKYK